MAGQPRPRRRSQLERNFEPTTATTTTTATTATTTMTATTATTTTTTPLAFMPSYVEKRPKRCPNSVTSKHLTVGSLHNSHQKSRPEESIEKSETAPAKRGCGL
mmetsp:Transcript_758/g.1202  ORF Transcript_758/g.1202 Transcript_758/m.1202 type:complete len:104 (-) Transcript_758:78-389(-)